jgi:uncharacterized membrane protein YkvA (DUF1232 family)
MRNSHLLSIQKEAHLSPEQLAERIGISGMTLRRWRQGSTNQNLPKIYERALVGVIGDLMAEGRFSFKKMGKEWRVRMSSLWTVLNSDELHTFDKCVAYGALFYLLMPFDLIPDSIPVIGSMDDFIILGFAVAYYVKRFPLIVKQSS